MHLQRLLHLKFCLNLKYRLKQNGQILWLKYLWSHFYKLIVFNEQLDLDFNKVKP